MKRLLAVLSILAFCSCGGNKQVKSERELLPIMEKALLDVNSRFYADFAQFPKDRRMLPIGIFGCGTDGLTLLEVLLSVDKIDNITGEIKSDGIPDFEGENFTYLADDANMPYGNYLSKGRENFFKELIVKDALFLLGDRYYFNNVDKDPLGVKQPSKIIIAACNTAAAHGLDEIETLLTESGTGIKVIGVVNAGADALFEVLEQRDIPESEADKDSVAVGVLATAGTLSSNAYESTILETKNARGYTGYIKVINQPGDGLSGAADMESDFINSAVKAPRSSYKGPKIGKREEDIKINLLPAYNFDYGNNNMLVSKENGVIKELQLNSALNYARFHLVSMLEKHRTQGAKVRLRHVILGCTNSSYLLDTLNKIVIGLREYKENGVYKYRDFIAKDFSFIDPAVFAAIECYKTLRDDKALALRTADGKLDAYISVPVFGLDPYNLDADGSLSYKFKYGREYGTEDITTVSVPFSARYINKQCLDRIERMLPHSFRLINNIID